MASSAVSDTGPLLHLTEINIIQALGIFDKIIIPEEVSSELRSMKINVPNRINVVKIKADFKDKVKIILNQNNIGLGESEAISLALQEKTNYFITDDLRAREVAKKYGLEVHGSVGILLRAFKNKIINRKTVIEKIRELKSKSSLFITSDLIEEIIDSVTNFKE